MWALIIVVSLSGSAVTTVTNIQTPQMCEDARSRFLANQDQDYVRARRITATCVKTSN